MKNKNAKWKMENGNYAASMDFPEKRRLVIALDARELNLMRWAKIRIIHLRNQCTSGRMRVLLRHRGNCIRKHEKEQRGQQHSRIVGRESKCGGRKAEQS